MLSLINKKKDTTYFVVDNSPKNVPIRLTLSLRVVRKICSLTISPKSFMNIPHLKFLVCENSKSKTPGTCTAVPQRAVASTCEGPARAALLSPETP